MLLVDDLLLGPVRGIFWILREIHNAAKQEFAGEPERIAAELRELYMMLETGRITAEAFEAQETVLLDRLDQIREYADPEETAHAAPEDESAAEAGS